MSSISAAHPQVGRVSGVEGKGEGLGPSEVPGMAPNSEVGLGTGGGDAELEGGLAEETGLNLGKPSLPGLSSPGISMGDPGFWPPAEPAAATLSSAQKATSHLSGRAPFRCDGLGWESIDRWRQRGVARSDGCCTKRNRKPGCGPFPRVVAGRFLRLGGGRKRLCLGDRGPTDEHGVGGSFSAGFRRLNLKPPSTSEPETRFFAGGGAGDSDTRLRRVDCGAASCWRVDEVYTLAAGLRHSSWAHRTATVAATRSLKPAPRGGEKQKKGRSVRGG